MHNSITFACPGHDGIGTAHECGSPVSAIADRTLAGRCRLSPEKLSSIDSAHASQADASSPEALLVCRQVVIVQASVRQCLKLVLASAHDLLSS